MKASARELPEIDVPTPAQWEKTVLGEFITAIETGKSFKCLERPPEGREVGVAKVSAVTWGEYQEQESKTCQDPNRVQERFLIREGDFLFSRANTVELVGACVIAKSVTRKIMLSDKILRLKFSEVLPLFVLYYLRSKQGRDQIKLLSTGNQQSMRNIGQDRIRAIRMPVPPLAEQHRIVAKIEELFSELDKGVESLKTARAQLKTYRQSLLKAAFEGRLTAQWRRDNADKLEAADQLLERIREEREARYHQQVEEWKVAVAEWESSGKPEKKPRKPSPPNEMPPPLESELAALPELPEGWHWEWLGNISEVSGGLTKNQKRKQFSLKRPFLRVANVYANQLILDEVHEVGITRAEAVKTTLEVGDLLIVEGNGSVDQIGRVAVWDGSIENCVHQNHLIRARLLESVLPRFALWFLLSKQGRELIVRTASSTSGLHTLSLSKVQNLLVPVCSSPEQSAVLDILDACLSQVDQMEQTVEAALQRTDALRQSTLKRAFEGKLVPQDPEDEPASALLERIRQEQADAPKPKRRKRKTEAPA